MIVVKVGGSLFDHPRFVPALRGYLDSLAPADVLLVPGGGEVVDAVRKLDAIHGLGEEASHWLAIRGMDLTGEFLRHTLPCGSRLRILDCFAFAKDDATLPHSWEVTSDSIAARVAIVHGAERLVLLKSVDVPAGMSWDEAAEREWVDPHFPRIVAGATFMIEVVNFRRALDAVASK
ncbi:MAG: uridylate kinase [Planctomycetes bacterium]|nr:uridylate kinase [Planctomycetota bacterium]